MSVRGFPFSAVVASAFVALAVGVFCAKGAENLPPEKPVKFTGRPGPQPDAKPVRDRDRIETMLPDQKLLNQSSLDGLPAPALAPPPRNIPSGKTREDRRSDWVFSTPEQIFLGPDKASLFEKKEGENLPTEANNLQQLNPMEQYYLDLFKSSPTASLRDGTDQNAEDSRLPAGLREKEDRLKAALLGPDFSTPKSSALSVASPAAGDLWGTQAPVLSAEQEAVRRMRMDDFRRSMGLPASTMTTKDLLAEMIRGPGATTANTLGSPSPLTEAPDSLLGKTAPSTSMIRPIDPQAGVIPTAPRLLDVNERVLNPGVLNVANNPKMEDKRAPARTAPQTPTFVAPRRVF